VFDFNGLCLIKLEHHNKPRRYKMTHCDADKTLSYEDVAARLDDLLVDWYTKVKTSHPELNMLNIENIGLTINKSRTDSEVSIPHTPDNGKGYLSTHSSPSVNSYIESTYYNKGDHSLLEALSSGDMPKAAKTLTDCEYHSPIFLSEDSEVGGYIYPDQEGILPNLLNENLKLCDDIYNLMSKISTFEPVDLSDPDNSLYITVTFGGCRDYNDRSKLCKFVAVDARVRHSPFLFDDGVVIIKEDLLKKITKLWTEDYNKTDMATLTEGYLDTAEWIENK
jgi:hypothetical protein